MNRSQYVTFRSLITGFSFVLNRDQIKQDFRKYLYVGYKFEGFEVLKISYK